MPSCPECDGPAVYMGVLGRLFHFRCRNCGIPFYVPVTHGEEVDDAA